MKVNWFWVSSRELKARGLVDGIPEIRIPLPIKYEADLGPLTGSEMLHPSPLRWRTFRLSSDPEAFSTESLTRPLDADAMPKRWWFYREVACAEELRRMTA